MFAIFFFFLENHMEMKNIERQILWFQGQKGRAKNTRPRIKKSVMSYLSRSLIDQDPLKFCVFFSRLFFNSKNENWIKFLALYKFFCGKKYDQNEKNILEEKILVREKFQIFFNSCNEFFGLIYVHMWHVVTFFQFLVLLE